MSSTLSDTQPAASAPAGAAERRSRPHIVAFDLIRLIIMVFVVSVHTLAFGGGTVFTVLALAPGAGRADGFDHRVAKDTGGIYSVQDAVPISLGMLAAGCALWRGSDDRLGKTCLACW